MTRIKVKSSNLKALDYDADTSTLTVEFHNGRVYQYNGVPEMAVKELCAAKSAGRYLNQVISKVYNHKELIEEAERPDPDPDPTLPARPRVIKRTQVRRMKK